MVCRNRRYACAVVGTLCLATGSAVAQDSVRLENLAAPRGLAISESGILIADQGNGRILRLDAGGELATLVEGVAAGPMVDPAGDTVLAGISAIADVGGAVYYLTNRAECFCVWTKSPDGPPAMLADLGAYEAANNVDGGVLPDGTPELQTNPYALVYDGLGGFYITDAAANAVLRVSLAGDIVPFAVFPDRENPLFGRVGGPLMDVVPTGIALGPDGAVYVGSLTGFPFPQGGAEIYRLADQNGDGDALDEGETTVFAGGVSSVVALAFDRDGTLLAAEFSTAQLAGAPGRLVRIVDGSVTEVAAPLVSPTGLAVLGDGTILVSQEFLGIVADVATATAIAASRPPG